MQEDIKPQTANEDLLSGAFTEAVNKKMIRRYIRLLMATIILFVIFTLLNFADWYIFIKGSKNILDTLLGNYHYIIQPVLVVVDAAILAISINYYIKGQKLILHALETDDADLFNRGYALLNQSAIWNVAGYFLLISGTLYRMTLDYLTK